MAQGDCSTSNDSHLSHEVWRRRPELTRAGGSPHVPTRRRKYPKSPKWTDSSPPIQERLFAPFAGPERFEAPQIQSFVMTKHVSVCIRRDHAKKRRVWRVPPVLYLHDLVHPPTHRKPHWPFVRPVSRITLHLNQHDLAVPHVTVFHMGSFAFPSHTSF
jgi:hypothetical protein